VLPVLDAIAEEVVPLKRPLRIEGHTDESPVEGGRYRDNWELSAARAATVTSYIERAHHAQPELLSATGLAATRPIAQGDTAEAREMNRRVELVVELDEVKVNTRPRKEFPRFDPLPR
jgi:chemotaxis protein MotB